MSAPGRAQSERAGEADKALLAVLAALIVLLLLATNVQLWRLASHDDAKGSVAATTGSSLPPPASGTSNDVLSRQLRKFSRQLTVPLNGLRTQLAGLQNAGDAQHEVAMQIKAMSASIRRFGGVRGEIGQMTKGLGKMVANTGAMSNGLTAMGRDMSATRKSIGGLVRVMKRVEGGIAATNASSREASQNIVAMRDAISAMTASITATAANGSETTASLLALNQNMSALLELFCVAFNSNTPQCATAETAGPAAATPAAPEPTGRSGGEVFQPWLGSDPPRQGLAPALRLGPAVGE